MGFSFFVIEVSKLTEVTTKMKTLRELLVSTRDFWGYGAALGTIRNQQVLPWRISLATVTCALFLPQNCDCGKALVLNPPPAFHRTRIVRVIHGRGARATPYLNPWADEKFLLGCLRVARATRLRKVSLAPKSRIAKSATPGANAARRISEHSRRRELNCRS